MQNTVLPNWLKKRAELSPNRIALIMNDKQVTFQELYEYSIEYASKLHSTGIQNGDSVGILVGNRFELVVTIHALMHIGAEIVFHNIRLTSEELAWQFQDAKLKWLITEDKYATKVAGTHSHRATIIMIEHISSMIVSEELAIVKEFALNKTATIMYTSGTTGNPKGVMQTYGNHWWSAVGSMLNLGLHEEDIWLCVVPMFHISGLSILYRSVIYGMTVVVHEQFDEEVANLAIRKHNVTIMSVVTATLNRMIVNLGEEKYPSTLRCMLLGGGPAPLSLLEACRDKEIPVFQTYGMTETSSQIVTLSPEYSIEKLGSAGKALFPSQLEIHVDSRLAEANEVGEIVVKGPNVTKGYANRPDATKAAFENGWFKTGDIGYLDSDGFLFVVDRRSDLIISGGENVYPAEIEAALMKHEAVFEAGVTGIEDDKWGQIPVGFVVVHESAQVSLDELQAHCQKYLASYKVPKRIYIVKELPRNSSNKLVRRNLKQMMEAKE
ncbi:o-succinylbenzoate--CoA ligase [Bacillus massiliigorillae]|uniref:o-succinylbenzoate--CoA ligase n=1 Tax=Bacillus massiliigorillae TaxID=1243664 RepID=UPI0005A7C453|nr:o-succinylbenzoate--CoA ligase [Bacillus massiliigorillae]